MSDWPFSPVSKITEDAVSGGFAATVATSGVSNTKSAWAELISATSFCVSEILLCVVNNVAGSRILLDVGIGAAGSEVVVAANLYINTSAASYGSMFFSLPIAIPSGERIAIRYQSISSTNNLQVSGVLYSGMNGSPPLETLGALTSGTTKGTDIDPGGTANTKGAWVEFSSGIAKDWAGFILNVASSTDIVRVSASFYVDVAIGASGSETLIAYDLMPAVSSTFDIVSQHPIYIPVHIKAGTRIAVRAASTTNTAGDRIIDAVIHGVPK